MPARLIKRFFAFASAPDDAVKFLKKRIHIVPRVPERTIEAYIDDLDSDFFNQRKLAFEQLCTLGDLAVPALRRRLNEKPSNEQRRAIERILTRVRQRSYSSAELQQLRSIQILEYASTNEAKEILESISMGAPASRITQEAKYAILRLQRK